MSCLRLGQSRLAVMQCLDLQWVSSLPLFTSIQSHVDGATTRMRERDVEVGTRLGAVGRPQLSAWAGPARRAPSANETPYDILKFCPLTAFASIL